MVALKTSSFDEKVFPFITIFPDVLKYGFHIESVRWEFADNFIEVIVFAVILI